MSWSIFNEDEIIVWAIFIYKTPITQHVLQSKMHFINIDILAVTSLLKLPNCKIASRSFYQTDPTSVTLAKEKDVTIQNSLSNFLINDLRIKNRSSVQSWHRSRFGEKTGPGNSSFKLRIAEVIVQRLSTCLIIKWSWVWFHAGLLGFLSFFLLS